jgi:hypothetical protein
MDSRYEATLAALARFDTVDQPALDAIRGHGGTSLNLSGFTLGLLP